MKGILIAFVFILFAAAAAETIPAAPGSMFLKAGWNLVSSPAEEPILNTTIVKYCTITAGPYYYDTSISPKEYKKTDRIQPFAGYWIKVEKACSVPVGDTDILEMKSLTLTKGWNIISGIGDFSDWEGCTILGGPWAYSNSLNAYNKETILTPEKGYWVRVSETCTLKKKTATAPPSTIPLPDLTIMGVDIYTVANDKNRTMSTTPVSRVSPNQYFAVVVTIANLGNAEVDKNSFQVNVMPQGTGSIGQSHAGILAPGKTEQYFFYTYPVTPMSYSKTGVYNIFAEVDSFKNVPEMNETNNVKTVQLGVF